MQTIRLENPAIQLKPLEEISAEIVCEEMGPPVFDCYGRLDWKTHGTIDDGLEKKLIVPEYLTGSVFYDGSKFTLTIDIGHMQPSPDEVRRAFDAMMVQLRAACRIVRDTRNRIQVRAGTVVAINEIARHHKDVRKWSNPFLRVASACLARRTSIRVTPISVRAEPIVAEDLVSMGMKISLSKRDLLLRRHDADIGAMFTEEMVTIPTMVPESLKQAAIGGPLRRILAMPGFDLIETKVVTIQAQGDKTKIYFKSPRIGLRDALILAKSLEEAAAVRKAELSA